METVDYLRSSFDIDPCTINICEFYNKWGNGQSHHKLWFSDKVLDIISRVTIDSPLVEIKKGEAFFKEERGFNSIPFLKLTPSGIPQKQFFNASSRRERNKLKKIIGAFFSFLQSNHDLSYFNYENVLVITYLTRWHEIDRCAICMYYEEESNTLNVFIKFHPLEMTDAKSFSFYENYWHFLKNIFIRRNKKIKDIV